MTKVRDAVAGLDAREVYLSEQSHTPYGERALLSTDHLGKAAEVGEAMDQRAGVISKSTEVAVTLDLVLCSGEVRAWVQKRVAQQIHAKVTGSFASHVTLLFLWTPSHPHNLDP